MMMPLAPLILCLSCAIEKKKRERKKEKSGEKKKHFRSGCFDTLYRPLLLAACSLLGRRVVEAENLKRSQSLCPLVHDCFTLISWKPTWRTSSLAQLYRQKTTTTNNHNQTHGYTANTTSTEVERTSTTTAESISSATSTKTTRSHLCKSWWA